MSTEPRPWFSASQVATFELCPRKWAWQKIDGIEPPEKPSTALGTAVHGQLEGWLRDGAPLDLTTEAGEIAMAGLHLLPAPGTPRLQVEEGFGLEMGGHRFRGAKDLQMIGGPVPIVYDHKTCSDFRWAKTPDDLRADPQATLYAADAMMRTGANACDLQWTYFRTRGARKAEAVRLRVTREDIAPRLEQTIASTAEMTALLASGCTAKDVPYDGSACEAFGGCPFIERCSLSPQERMTSIMTQQSVASLLADLQARQNGINPPAVGPTAPVVATPIPPVIHQPVVPAAPAPTPALAPPTATTFAAPTAAPAPAPVAAPEPKRRGRPQRALATEGDAYDGAPTSSVLSSLLEQAATLQECTARMMRTAAELARSLS